MMTPEAVVKRDIRVILDKYAVMYYMPSAAVYGAHGASDFLCCVQGRYLAIEAKATKKEKPSRLQSLFMERVQLAGGSAWVINADNIKELPRLLRELIKE